MEFLIVLGYIAYCLVLLAGVGATLVGLPGTVLILADALVFSICTHFQRPSWGVLLALAIISLVAELSDNLFSALATRYGGGSSKSGLAAMLGGLGGALVGGALSPLIGSLGLLGGLFGFLLGVVIVPVGLALAGGYGAAVWYEQKQGRTREEALRAGKAAVIGRLLGTMAKGLFAAIMAGIALYAVFHHAAA